MLWICQNRPISPFPSLPGPSDPSRIRTASPLCSKRSQLTDHPSKHQHLKFHAKRPPQSHGIGQSRSWLAGMGVLLAPGSSPPFFYPFHLYISIGDTYTDLPSEHAAHESPQNSHNHSIILPSPYPCPQSIPHSKRFERCPEHASNPFGTSNYTCFSILAPNVRLNRSEWTALLATVWGGVLRFTVCFFSLASNLGRPR